MKKCSKCGATMTPIVVPVAIGAVIIPMPSSFVCPACQNVE